MPRKEADLVNLQGILYTLSEKIALNSDLGVAHPDAKAYERAFKQVLDYPKHQCPIQLEARLAYDIPAGLAKKD